MKEQEIKLGIFGLNRGGAFFPALEFHNVIARVNATYKIRDSSFLISEISYFVSKNLFAYRSILKLKQYPISFSVHESSIVALDTI